MPRWRSSWHTQNTFEASVPRCCAGSDDIARTNGLHHLVAEVLWENHLMLRVLSETGWPCTRHLEGSVLHVEIDLGVEPPLAER